MADALSDCRLYSRFTGGPGLQQDCWFIQSKSHTHAIKVTVKFTDSASLTNNTRTESFALEPGEEKRIGIKSEFSGSSEVKPIAAEIVGARYL